MPEYKINWKKEAEKATKYLTEKQQNAIALLIRDLQKTIKSNKGTSIDWKKIYDLCIRLHRENKEENK